MAAAEEVPATTDPIIDPTEPKGLPDVPASWTAALAQVRLIIREIAIVVTLVLSVVTAVTSIWTREKVVKVQEHQEVNTAKLDAVKGDAELAASKAAEVKIATDVHAQKVESKIDAIDKKTDTIKSAVKGGP